MSTSNDAISQQPNEEPDRSAQPVDDEQPPQLPFAVVGIGASAGGLEAISSFLEVMPTDSGLAIVIVQHLPPDHESMMAEILERRTAMSVYQIEEGMTVKPNHVYVIRPGHRLTIRNGRLHLGLSLKSPRAANRPIDDFFRSLAQEQRERAICVVMSGMGSNGTAGAQAVKAVGGLCIAQDPESALFSSMPRHLIDAGYADYVLRPRDIPDILLAYAGHPYSQGGRESDAEAILSREQQHFREILAVLRTRVHQDFSGYKKPTLLRRIQRRMGLTHLTGMSDYTRLLRQSPSEVSSLADDLLIHVTGFFRDSDAWEALRLKVVVPLIESRESGESVRAWVTACSSGEESYSLAMLLVEESERVGKTLDVKVFATDLADRALAHARAGVYPGGIESEIPPDRLARFFTMDDEVYRVRPELRDRVVFAPQNVLQDPPFSRIDIASCRNLLIYLEPEVQQRVLGLLHFGLRENGTLFLGTSETVAGVEELFEPIDKKARLYRRIGPTRHGSVDFPLPHMMPLSKGGVGLTVARNHRGPLARPEGTRPSNAELVQQTMLRWHTPPAVMIDRDGRIVYYHGDTRPFLQQLSGEPTRELMLLVREGIRGPVRIAIHRAIVGDIKSTVSDGWVEIEHGRRAQVVITASPIVDVSSTPTTLPDYFVVSFELRGEVVPQKGTSTGVELGVPVELRRLREELQSTVEELQTSNEELMASNEEVMSINEELQSANEELETSKEEMQSLNEELTTVNSQLRAKMEEHMASSSDLMSLLASTDIAVLFLDQAFRIRRFTPAIRDLVDLIPSDIGRPLAALAFRFEDPNLDRDCRTVLDRLLPIEQEIASSDGRHFLRRTLPYRTMDQRIDGVVITFVDISARRSAEAAMRESRGELASEVSALVRLHEASTRLWRSQDLRSGLEEILDAAVGMLQADMGLIQLLNPDSLNLEIVAQYGFKPEFLELFHEVSLEANSAYGWSLQSGSRIIIEDVETDAESESLRAVASAANYRAVQSTPMIDRDGRPLGMLSTCYHDKKRPREQDLRRLDLYVRQAVAFIERQRIYAALRASEGRLQRIVASATDYAILTLDQELRITDWSPGAEVIFGYSKEEIVGKPSLILFTAEDREAGAPHEEALTARLKGRADDERWHLRKDGSRFYASGVLTTLEPIESLTESERDVASDVLTTIARRDPLGFVKVLRDLTDRKRMEDDLRSAHDQLEARVAERTAELTRSNEARVELLRRLVNAQEGERQRVSRELHDGLGQELTSLILSLSALKHELPEDSSDWNRFQELEEIVRRIGREAHDLAVELRPTALDDIGLESALATYISRWSARTGVNADFQALGLSGGRLAPDIETTAYRIVQEALNNIAKHAGAAQVSVIVEQRDNELTALVEDDGRGFEVDRLNSELERGRLGLLGMRERLALVGGTLRIDSSLGEGCILRVRIPLTSFHKEVDHE